MNGNQEIEVLLLGIEPYFFTDKTGRNVELVGVYFVEPKPEDNEYAKGYIPKKVNVSIENLSILRDLEYPYVASAKVEARLTKRGIVSKVIGFEPIRKIDFGWNN